jgi:hypothetical protein
VPICRALSAHGVPIAQRTYWARRSRPPSRRAPGDAAVTEILAGIYQPDERCRRPAESLYGSLKMWPHLRRQGIGVTRCTVERLMRAHGWRGVTRARRIRTTMPDPAHGRAPDLVNRDFLTKREDIETRALIEYYENHHVPLICSLAPTPIALTSPLIVVPYALWARRLQRNGLWQPMPGRALALSLLAVPPFVAGAQALARILAKARH